MDAEEEPSVVAFTGRVSPDCFHVSGQFGNHIVDCHGVCVQTSTEVRVVYDAVNSSKLYYQYVPKFSTDIYQCTICSTGYSSQDGDKRTVSNIIKHVKNTHPEVVPFNFMSETYIVKKSKVIPLVLVEYTRLSKTAGVVALEAHIISASAWIILKSKVTYRPR